MVQQARASPRKKTLSLSLGKGKSKKSTGSKLLKGNATALGSLKPSASSKQAQSASVPPPPYSGLTNLGFTQALQSQTQQHQERQQEREQWDYGNADALDSVPSGGRSAAAAVKKRKREKKRSAVTDELSALYSEMLAAEAKETASTSGSRVVTRPADFLAALREANPMFQGSWQQDAQELLRFLLNHLQEVEQQLRIDDNAAAAADMCVDIAMQQQARPEGEKKDEKKVEKKVEKKEDIKSGQQLQRGGGEEKMKLSDDDNGEGELVHGSTHALPGSSSNAAGDGGGGGAEEGEGSVSAMPAPAATNTTVNPKESPKNDTSSAAVVPPVVPAAVERASDADSDARKTAAASNDKSLLATEISATISNGTTNLPKGNDAAESESAADADAIMPATDSAAGGGRTSGGGGSPPASTALAKRPMAAPAASADGQASFSVNSSRGDGGGGPAEEEGHPASHEEEEEEKIVSTPTKAVAPTPPPLSTTSTTTTTPTPSASTSPTEPPEPSAQPSSQTLPPYGSPLRSSPAPSVVSPVTSPSISASQQRLKNHGGVQKRRRLNHRPKKTAASASRHSSGGISSGDNPNDVPSAISDLFEGKLAYTTRCVECESTSRRSEPFFDLTLPASSQPGRSVNWALSQLCDVRERMNGGNKYFCSVCKTHTEASESADTVQLPESA